MVQKHVNLHSSLGPSKMNWVQVLNNTSAYIIAGMAPKLVNLFMLPIYTRYLESRDYGIISLTTVLSSFLLVFAGLQLVNSIARFYYEAAVMGFPLEQIPALL